MRVTGAGVLQASLDSHTSEHAHACCSSPFQAFHYTSSSRLSNLLGGHVLHSSTPVDQIVRHVLAPPALQAQILLSALYFGPLPVHQHALLARTLQSYA